MQIILTHEHADAVLGLDDIRAVQPHSPTNDIDPTAIFLTQYAMDRYNINFLFVGSLCMYYFSSLTIVIYADTLSRHMLFTYFYNVRGYCFHML